MSDLCDLMACEVDDAQWDDEDEVLGNDDWDDAGDGDGDVEQVQEDVSTPGLRHLSAIKAIKLALYRVVLLTGCIGRKPDGTSGTVVRVQATPEPTPAPSPPSPQAKKKARSTSWVKGTGYGSHSSSNFDMSAAVAAKTVSDTELAKEIGSLCDEISKCPTQLMSYLTDLISESSLLSSMVAVLDLDSMLEADLYHLSLLNVLRLCRLFSECDDLSVLGYLPTPSGRTVYAALSALELQAASAHALMSQTAVSAEDLGIIGTILSEAQATLVSCHIESFQETRSPATSMPADVQGQYEALVKADCFSMVDELPGHLIPTATGNASAAAVRRMATEISCLSGSLPVNFDSSVVVRACQSDLRLARVAIFPSSGTPYSNGAFVFDVCFPNDYPQSPPIMKLRTTGGGRVRFNPNLYNEGKVCLSLLNTWQGSPAESWNAKTSTFLQVLVSIQALIFIPTPYFNEPGYEGIMGTPNGDSASAAYNRDLYPSTILYAMLEQIEKPDPLFADVIHAHFALKKDIIKKQVKEWNIKKDIEKKLFARLDALPVPSVSTASSSCKQ